MKNFENFEAFKMSKTQMNAIAGGTIYCYSSSDFDDQEVYFENVDMDKAQAGAETAFGESTICEELIKA